MAENAELCLELILLCSVKTSFSWDHETQAGLRPHWGEEKDRQWEPTDLPADGLPSLVYSGHYTMQGNFTAHKNDIY